MECSKCSGIAKSLRHGHDMDMELMHIVHPTHRQLTTNRVPPVSLDYERYGNGGLYCIIPTPSAMAIVEVVEKRRLSDSDVYVSVLVALVDPCDTSKCLRYLSEKLPLDMYGLRHLKRARKAEVGLDGSNKLEIVMCPSNHEANLSEDVKKMFPDTCYRLVCKERPCTREEFKLWGNHWPVVFRPSEASEEQEKGLSDAEIATATKYFNLLQQQHLPNRSVVSQECIVVDPASDQVVMTYVDARGYLNMRFGEDRIGGHSLYTAGMTCIEGVAAVVRGDMTPVHAERQACDMTEKNQYLCTGFDMYLQHEPDVMTAMALVHSRIRRVYFQRIHRDSGGLGGRWSIHTMKGLNHHFRAFTYDTTYIATK